MHGRAGDALTQCNNTALGEQVMQQLRGIFAAHDEDKDLLIDQAELADAIRAIGSSPTDALVSQFMDRRPVKVRVQVHLQLEAHLPVEGALDGVLWHSHRPRTAAPRGSAGCSAPPETADRTNRNH